MDYIITKYVYLLQHSYEVGKFYDETKVIGIYSTEENAKKAIEKLKNLNGFKNHDINCFYINKYKIDEDNWTTGFLRL